MRRLALHLKHLLDAIRKRLRPDPDDDYLVEPALTAKTDPALAQLWDNPKDSTYDRL